MISEPVLSGEPHLVEKPVETCGGSGRVCGTAMRVRLSRLAALWTTRACREIGVQMEQAQVVVRRSARRKKTVTAYREGGEIIVVLPGRMSARDERYWVERMLERLHAKETRRVSGSDDELATRALELSQRYLAPALGGRVLRPTSVTWVANQRKRWGSTTPDTGAIRLSDRLWPLPSWVSDYVLLHELAHLEHPDHTAAFWALLSGYPDTERARGFLEGYSHAQAHGADQGEEDNEEGSGETGGSVERTG